jgi:hypothetical protein
MNTTITCNLMGGLGNQLFQVAAAYSLSRSLHLPFGIIEQQFGGAGTGSHPSKYYSTLFRNIPRFQLNRTCVSYKEPKWTYTPLLESIKTLLQPSTILQLDGYFQSDQYFIEHAADLKQLLTPNGFVQDWLKTHTTLFSSYPELFEPHDFCFIGVRRGDYITKAKFHNPCGLDYYQKAMASLPAARYYIGSDDVAWCREQFKGDQFVIFDLRDDLQQFFIGCLFKNYIIANSTFHWWMSFLSVYESPAIVAPDKWVFGPNVQLSEYYTIYRKGMRVIQRLIEA